MPMRFECGTFQVDRDGLIVVEVLDMFNAELSTERYMLGPRSQEVGKEGDYT